MGSVNSWRSPMQTVERIEAHGLNHDIDVPDLDDSTLPANLLSSLVATSSLLDAASLFEIVGSKWMLAVPFEYWDAEIHEHCSDEVRHTKMVQDEAKKLRWEMEPEDVLKELQLSKVFYTETEKYLSRLSRKIFKLTLAAGRHTKEFSVPSYALVAFLIERRIMKIYPGMAQHAPSESVKTMARQLITDERKHLKAVGLRLPEGLALTGKDQKAVVDIEEELAATWIHSLTKAFNEICA